MISFTIVHGNVKKCQIRFLFSFIWSLNIFPLCHTFFQTTCILHYLDFRYIQYDPPPNFGRKLDPTSGKLDLPFSYVLLKAWNFQSKPSPETCVSSTITKPFRLRWTFNNSYERRPTERYKCIYWSDSTHFMFTRTALQAF